MEQGLKIKKYTNKLRNDTQTLLKMKVPLEGFAIFILTASGFCRISGNFDKGKI